jgi:hypothetical protein
MPLEPPLDYEPVRPSPAPFWRRNVLLWAIICFNGYAIAVIGPLFVIVGIGSFFVDLPAGYSLSMFGKPVQTVPQKMLWTLLNLLLGALGVGSSLGTGSPGDADKGTCRITGQDG